MLRPRHRQFSCSIAQGLHLSNLVVVVLVEVFLIGGEAKTVVNKVSVDVAPRSLMCLHQDVVDGEQITAFFVIAPRASIYFDNDGHHYEYTVVQVPADQREKNQVKMRESSRRQGQLNLDVKGNSTLNFCLDASRVDAATMFTLGLSIVSRQVASVTRDQFLDIDSDFVRPVFKIQPEEAGGQDALKIVSRISAKMHRAFQLLNEFRDFEKLGRLRAEEAFERVNKWSLLQVVVMLVTAFIQIFTIKSLFD